MIDRSSVRYFLWVSPFWTWIFPIIINGGVDNFTLFNPGGKFIKFNLLHRVLDFHKIDKLITMR